MQVRQSEDYPIFRRSRIKMGVGFEMAVSIWGAAGFVSALVGMPLAVLPVLLAALVHAIAAWFYRSDDKIMQLYTHYAATPDALRAGLPSDGEPSTRPEGYAKNASL